MSGFDDPQAVASYEANAARRVPGLRDLHRMVGVLLAERVATDGRVLVVGAGGGLELRAFTALQPGWRFDGVDPSAEMLAQARTTLGPHAGRVRFHHGYVADAPEGPFDGATCLLTLHFLPRDERVATLREIRRRLVPGGPLVVVHHSIPSEADGLSRWLSRGAEFTIAAGVPAAQARAGVVAIKDRLPILSPTDDEAVLREAGFNGVEQFYAAFTFRGWVGFRG